MATNSFNRLTPRTAVIVMPSPNQSFKYLFGSAFRAPNAYELNANYFGVTNLRPESINTHELVWERYTNDWLRTSVSTYWYQADSLITLTPDSSAPLGTTYINEGRVRAKGLELEAQMRLRAVQGPSGVTRCNRWTDRDTQKALGPICRVTCWKTRVSVDLADCSLPPSRSRGSNLSAAERRSPATPSRRPRLPV